MPMCKFCAKPFSWGNDNGRWRPLVPIGDDDGMDRSYQDENGVLRADHNDVCLRAGGPSVRVSRLQVKVPGEAVLPQGHVDSMDELTTGAEQVAMRKKHRPRRRTPAALQEWPY